MTMKDRRRKVTPTMMSEMSGLRKEGGCRIGGELSNHDEVKRFVCSVMKLRKRRLKC